MLRVTTLSKVGDDAYEEPNGEYMDTLNYTSRSLTILERVEAPSESELEDPANPLAEFLDEGEMLADKPYNELQSFATDHGIKGNLPKEEMVDAISEKFIPQP